MSPADGDAPQPRYRDIRFCPRCGTAYAEGDFDRRDHLYLCRACDFDFYQNPIPSAVVAIAHPEQPDRVLMLRRRTPPRIGRWCLPGGFIRYGELPALAAAREAREETGVDAQIGDVLRVGMFDYLHRGRLVCVLEVVYAARLASATAFAGRTTNEASEVAFLPIDELVLEPEALAFPQHADVLRTMRARLAR